jgi:hypothetical protein
MPVAEARTDLTGPRWSSAVICPRRAVYDAQEAPRDPMPERIEGARWRGQVIGKAVAAEIVARWRAQGRRPRVEVEVPWPSNDPVGIGHMDVWLPSEKRVVEIKTQAACELTAPAALQAAGYALNYKAARHAAVVVVDPVSGLDREYPIHVAGLARKVAEIEQQVVAGVREGELPERVCRTPADGPALICPYVTWCFADFQVEHVPAPEMGAAFQRLAEIERMMKFSKHETETLASEREQLRAELRPHLELGVDHVAGGYRVRVIEIPEIERFSLTDYRKAGYEADERMASFVKTQKASERWYLAEIR